MVGTTSSADGVLVDLLKPILPKIGGELTRESLIDLHWLISRKSASMASNLRGGRHVHLMKIMTAKEYMAQMGYTFLPSHKTGTYPPTMGTAQEKALRTERFQQNQALFRRYTTVDRALKIRSSWRCNQYFCNHWWTSWQVLDRFPRSLRYNNY